MNPMANYLLLEDGNPTAYQLASTIHRLVPGECEVESGIGRSPRMMQHQHLPPLGLGVVEVSHTKDGSSYLGDSSAGLVISKVVFKFTTEPIVMSI